MSQDCPINLFSIHILKKTTIIITNLPKNLSNKKLLYKHQYLGQYGQITKLSISKATQHSYKAMVSFETKKEAALALISINNIKVENKTIHANYSVVKYCNNFLNNQECNNEDCIFIHHLISEVNSIDNNYMVIKNFSNEVINHKQLALEILDINEDVYNSIVFPLIKEMNNKRMNDNSEKESNMLISLIIFPKVSLKLLGKESKEDEMEYVLVRETKQKSSYNNNNKNRYNKQIKHNHIPFKRGCVLKQEQHNITCMNDGDKSVFGKKIIEINGNNGNFWKVNKRIPKSRFGFVKNSIDCNKDCVDIPEFVFDLVDAKINKIIDNHNNTKNNHNDVDSFDSFQKIIDEQIKVIERDISNTNISCPWREILRY